MGQAVKPGEDTSQLRPRRNPGVQWDTDPDGRVRLRRRKFGPVGTTVLRMFRIRPELTIHLDPIGSQVWLVLDGRTVANVLQELQEKHPDEDQLPPRLGHYLSILASNRFIHFD